MTNLKRLHTEFKALKEELFQGASFAILDDDDPKVARYQQLLQFFFPCYRTKDYTDPVATDEQQAEEYELYYSL